MSRIKLSLIAVLFIAVAGCGSSEAPSETPAADYAPPITLFVAQELITMSDKIPGRTNAVAVQNGKILAVGDKEPMLQPSRAPGSASSCATSCLC